MEVAGLVVGIVGLYTACQSCYSLFSDAKNAEASTILAARELDIHGSILKAWACYWEIKPTPPKVDSKKDEGQISQKLARYLERNQYKAMGIAAALQCIGDVLSDKQKLLATYGVEVNLEMTNTTDVGETAEQNRTWKQFTDNIKAKTQQISSRINQKRKFAWALKDGSKFKALIVELKKHNDALHLLGPEWAFELLQINLALEYLPRQDTSGLNQLRETSTKSSEGERDGWQANEAMPVTSPSQGGIQLLLHLADLKAQAALSAREVNLGVEEERNLLSFAPDDFQMGEAGMAVWWAGKETVFIETHGYTTPGSDTRVGQRIRTNILKLGRLLQLPVCVKHLHALELLGMVEFQRRKEIGFVYRLPGSLGKHRRGFPIEDMLVRKPRQALAKRNNDIDPPLGFRFDLARKLVQSVAFLHASGWFHKNIRTTELIFFPKDNKTISRERGCIDLDKPFLLGYRFSRPDDVQEQDGESDQGNYPSEQVEATSPLPSVVIQPPLAPRHKTIPPQTEKPQQAGLQWPGTPVPPAHEHPQPKKAVGFVASRDDESDDYDLDESGSNRSPIYAHDPRVSREPHRIELDLRHHPSKNFKPDRRYCHAFDVYSLGVALVEIGMWRDINFVIDNIPDDPFEVSRRIIEVAESHLPVMCGEIYTRVALACLMVDPEGDEDGLVEQRELCAKVAADLAHCRA